MTLAEFEQLKREILRTTTVPAEESSDKPKPSKWWQVLMTLPAFLVSYGAYKLVRDLMGLFTS